MKLIHTYFLALCMLLGLLISTPACTKSATANAQYAAATTTLTVETAQDGAVTMYRAEQEEVLAQAIKEGVTKAEAQARIAKVREKWQPLWDAFQGVRACHAVLVAALQGHTDDDVPTAYIHLVESQRKLGDVLAQFRKVP